MNKFAGKKEISTLLSFIAEGLILFDEKGVITLVNPHAALLLDYTSEEMIGKKIGFVFDIFIGRKKLSKNEIIKILFKDKKTFFTPSGKVVYFKSRGGRKFPVFVSSKPLSSGGVMVFRDITTEKKLEKYKLNTAKRLAYLTPIFQKTSTGDFSVRVDISPKEDEFTELFVGLNLMMDDLEELEKTRKKIVKESIKTEREKRKLSEKYSKELEKQVKEKTKELSRSKIHIEAIIENLTSGLIEFNREGQIVRINKTAENLLGIKRSIILGKKIILKKDGDKGWQSLVEVSRPELFSDSKKIKHGIPISVSEAYEVNIKYPLERDLYVSTIPVVGDSFSKKTGFIKVIRDITREKIIAKSKSEFISVAAHQLRTPLSAVRWALESLIKGGKNNLKKSQIDLLEKSFEANERMINLAGDLLNVAKIEEGRLGYEFGKNNITKIISSIIASSEIYAKKKQIKIIFKKEDSIEPFVFDEKKLSLALQNLVDNAMKYTLRGGIIRIYLEKEDKYVKIEVQDTGIGIPKEQIGRMFTKFFRAENVKRVETSGSGLGLFISKNIIIGHGGKINVQSEEGVGTTFIIRLPMDESLIPRQNKLI